MKVAAAKNLSSLGNPQRKSSQGSRLLDAMKSVRNQTEVFAHRRPDNPPTGTAKTLRVAQR